MAYSDTMKQKIEDNLATYPARREATRKENVSAVAARLRQIADYLESPENSGGDYVSALRRHVIAELLHDQQAEDGKADYLVQSSVQMFIGQDGSDPKDSPTMEALERACHIPGWLKLRRVPRRSPANAETDTKES